MEIFDDNDLFVIYLIDQEMWYEEILFLSGYDLPDCSIFPRQLPENLRTRLFIRSHEGSHGIGLHLVVKGVLFDRLYDLLSLHFHFAALPVEYVLHQRLSLLFGRLIKLPRQCLRKYVEPLIEVILQFFSCNRLIERLQWFSLAFYL